MKNFQRSVHGGYTTLSYDVIHDVCVLIYTCKSGSDFARHLRLDQRLAWLHVLRIN